MCEDLSATTKGASGTFAGREFFVYSSASGTKILLVTKHVLEKTIHLQKELLDWLKISLRQFVGFET